MKIQSCVSIDGRLIPTFLYGTAWKESATERCVLEALRSGFRAIDTANQRKHYFEAGVGAALVKEYEAGRVVREDLFLQTKFTHLPGQDHRLPYDPKKDLRNQVLQSFESSLEHLHTSYIDSYVLHGPSRRNSLADEDWEAWRAMEELHRNGTAKSLGVSNVNLGQLEELLDGASVKPLFVQNRCYARIGWDREVRMFCNRNEILYQGFSLLTANSEVFRNQKFIQIAERHRQTPAQVIFRFALEVGMLPITGTTNPDHMREDLVTYNFELSAGEVEIIESIAESSAD